MEKIWEKGKEFWGRADGLDL